MSTSILYHGFGIRGYRYVRTEFQQGTIVFTIEKDRTALRCPSCQGSDVIKRGTLPRFFHSLSIGRKKTYIKLYIPRVFCSICNAVRQISLGFADTRFTYTKSFSRYAMELSRHMTIKDVATHLHIGWDVVKEIQRRYLEQHFSRPVLKHVQLIAIDEISIGKHHRYLTVVLDLETGAIVFVGDGKGADALRPFWKRLQHSRATIQAVATDMSPAYISAVSENLPKATIVFDHFHIIKMFNDKLSKFRRSQYKQASQDGKKILKGTRWLLLKNPENLDDTRNETERLQEALDLNKSLATAYYLKEDLRQVWSQEDKQTASAYLDGWISRARSSDIFMLMSLSVTIERHRSGILAYYDFPISTGPLEGTNNKIKTLQKQAYGFRDIEFFKLKIYALHQTKYALVG